MDTGSRDRWSLEWMLEHGMVQGIISAAAGFLFTIALQGRGDIPSSGFVTVLGVVFFYGLGAVIALLLGKVSGNAASSLYTPSGDSTAYTPTFSHIDTLVIRGNLDGASDAWDVAMSEHPASPGVMVKAADFHLRERKDATRALALYLRARQLKSGGEDLRRYVQQKIVDLHLGPLNDEGRALVELRRLVEAFPASREADGAREALAAIKAKRDQRPS